MATDLQDIPQLDQNVKLVKEDGSASVYFEELWYGLQKSIEAINACLEDHEARIEALENP